MPFPRRCSTMFRGLCVYTVLAMLLGSLSAGKPLLSLRRQVCSDLCTSGLGGAPCGALCDNDLGFGIQNYSMAAVPQNYTMAVSQSDNIYGPRRAVCPRLCRSALGMPLCDCQPDSALIHQPVDWSAICEAFCKLEGYTVFGCERCTVVAVRPAAKAKLLNKKDGIDWEELCAYLCSKGEGGAACNCDAVP
ncbi:uncharacterized protein [Periplaneta americana]|uniref:uncharacterized protein n=1 Tax=Periplaneta americana TaxID=6978 RepID=UPI0037E93105